MIEMVSTIELCDLTTVVDSSALEFLGFEVTILCEIEIQCVECEILGVLCSFSLTLEIFGDYIVA